MQKYKCNLCGYIFDPELGDPDGGIPPDTPFEEVLETWECPGCGTTKIVDEFEKVEEGGKK